MAMNKTVLGAALKSAMDDLTDPTDRDELFEAFAGAIIDHIRVATVIVTSVTGVTTGVGISGPGTGTIS